MKKAKTLLGTLIIMIVSIFASACACSGEGDVSHVYEQDINVRCVTVNDNVTSSFDEVGGFLIIDCFEGDRFVIEYEITPENATTTQVNWEFKEGAGAVEPYRRDYSRNKSTKEQVEFEARSEGSTKLVFKTQTLGKEATCLITVHKPIAELPTLVAPENLRFDPVENALKWNHVNAVYEPSNPNVPNTNNNAALLSMTGYDVVSIDENGVETKVASLDRTVTKYTGIEAGKLYSFKVKAVGFKYGVKDSAYSEPYTFYKLKPATDIKNNNGDISYTANDYASQIRFYHFGSPNDYDYSQVYAPNVHAGDTNTFRHTLFPNYANSTSYSIVTISYPADFSDEVGYSIIDGVRYFPSDETEPVDVMKFRMSTVDLVDTMVNSLMVNNVTFENVHGDTSISLGIIDDISYNAIYEQGFEYQVFSSDNTEESIATGIIQNSILNINTIPNVLPGYSYTIKVKTVGNPENTIESTNWADLQFTVAAHLTSDSVTLDGDILHNNTDLNTGGIEFFFVNANDSTKTLYRAQTTDNGVDFALDDLALTPGVYKVYGKEICHIEGGYRVAVITPTTFNELLTITVVNNVPNNKITADSDIRFVKINSYDSYEIKIKRINRDDADEFIEKSVIAYKYSTQNELLGLLTYQLGNWTEDGVEYTASLSLRDAIDYLVENDQFEDEDGINVTDDFFNSDYYIQYSIVTVGDTGSDSGDTVISSRGTDAVTAYIFDSVGEITLENYVATFGKVGTSSVQKYIVTLTVRKTESLDSDNDGTPDSITTEDVNEYTFNSFIGDISGDIIICDLTTLRTADGKSFEDLICTTRPYLDILSNTTTYYTNIISVGALGNGGQINSPATLNSMPSRKAFEITNTPEELSMTSDGILSFSTTTLVENIDSYTYSIYFYKAETDDEISYTYTLLSDDTIERVALAHTSTREGVVNGENKTLPVFTYNIADILNKYKDELIAVTVVEHTADKFNGAESRMLYATRITSPVLGYDTIINDTVTHDVIKWDEVNNADVFDISATLLESMVSITEETGEEGGEGESGGEGEDPSDEPVTPPAFSFNLAGHQDTKLSITDRINHATNSWSEGTYIISISARNSQASTTGVTPGAPCVINSEASTIAVYIVSRSIVVSVDDNTLSWDNVSPNAIVDNTATYEITYKLGDYGEETTEELGSQTSFDTTSAVANGFANSGTYKVTVSPSIVFKDTGYILIRDDKINSIEKLATATALQSSAGNFEFKLYGFTDEESPQFDLYQVKDGQDLIISKDNYYINNVNDKPESATDENGDYLKYNVVLDGITTGPITLKVKLKASGYLSSNLSEPYTGTKIASVSDLTKEGEWLTWSSQPGVSAYQINYRYLIAGKAELSSLLLRVDYNDNGDGTYLYDTWVKKIQITGEGDEAVTSEIEVKNDPSFVFDADTKKFKFQFDHDLFVKVTGDIIFTIRPITDRAGYFSGNTSAGTTITKLNANSAVTVIDGKVNIADYEADGTQTPVEYIVNIYMLEEGTTTDPETGDTIGTGELSRKLDGAGNPVMWTSGNKAYAIQDGVQDIAPIDLNVLSYIGVDGESNTKVYSFKAEGDYEIEVIFVGDGNKIITSNTILNSELDKLATTSLSTVEGEVEWDTVTGAEYYTVEITDGENTYYFKVEGNTLKGQTLQLPVTQNPEDQPTDDPSVQSVDGDNVFSFDPGVLYTLRIKANAEGKLHSKWSQPFNVKKLIAPTGVAISASTATRKVLVEQEFEIGEGETEIRVVEITIPVDAPIVTWIDKNITDLKLSSELIYGEALTINIPHSADPIKDGQDVVGYKSIYALTNGLPVGVYGLQIRTWGNTSTGTDNMGYLNSDYSDAVDVNYVDDVADPVVTNGYVQWADVQGAYSYLVTAYTTENYNYYLADPENIALAPVFATYTTNNSLDLTQMSLAHLNKYNGAYTFVVKAITNPIESIVSSETTSNSAVAVYKPDTLKETFKVKNGMLSWRISIADIKAFVGTQMIAGDETGTRFAIPEDAEIDRTSVDAVTAYILQYIMIKINSGEGENADLEAQLSHLLEYNLDINGVVIIDTPTSANIIKVEDGGAIENIVISPMGYVSADYIEYYYDVSIEPEIDNSTPEITPEPDNPENGDDPVAVTSAGENTAEVEYSAGKYNIRISPRGNANPDVAIISGGYTPILTAYKPNTPITWTTGGADISYGKVQWELSTTQDTNMNQMVYYKDYTITAIPVDGVAMGYVDVNIDETIVDGVNKNLQDNYKYYRDLKGDLFRTESYAGNPTNIIDYNTDYRLLIRTKGTVDSSKLATGETIYLNSNACVVGSVANILDTTPDVKIEDSRLTWNTSRGSTATKVYIYGPFDNLNGTKTKINSNWASENVSDRILALIDDVYNNVEGIAQNHIDAYKGKLRIVEFAMTELAERQTSYSLTNELLNDRSFEPGGYIIKLQELGDDKGRVDSVISEGYEVIKLGYCNVSQTIDIKQSTGWVGMAESPVYVWDPITDTWITKTYPVGSPNQVIGTFVWNPVVGANAYKVEIFRKDKVSSATEFTGIVDYTSETTYELPSRIELNSSDYTYYIVVTSMRVEYDGMFNYSQLSDNYFSADYRESSDHERLAIPQDLTIFGTGRIEWDNGIHYTTVGSYRVKFNFGERFNEEEIKSAINNNGQVPTLNLGDGSQNGTIAIAVKSVPQSGNGYLNSSYCEAVAVTRLADPRLRLIDGVLYWGSEGDPVTDTELTINGTKQVITTPEGEVTYDTFMKFYTEVVAHDQSYKATTDESIYAPIEYVLKAMFQGTGGEEGKTMGGDENFYIASNLKTMIATKLNAPIIENVRLNVAQNNENMVRWELDNNAQGYRVRVFSSNAEDGSFEQVDVDKATIETLLSEGTTDHEYFLAQNIDSKNYVYFKLTKVIEKLELNTIGGTIYVYVQALGSGVTLGDENPENFAVLPNMNGDIQLNDMYLSSSYSTFTSIGVPPRPTELAYNTKTGVFSWVVNDPAAYNVKVENDYAVNRVSASDLDNYWRKTSDVFYELDSDTAIQSPDIYRPYKEIINRTTTILSTEEINSETYYNLRVVDVIRLLASDYGNTTPTSYQLTTIGTDYNMSVRAMSFISDSGDEMFASDSVTFIPAIAFELFGKGDGSTAYPYTVSEAPQLQRISNFTTRQFSITEDITMRDAEGGQILWAPIKGEFTGVINGNGYTIKEFASEAIMDSTGASAMMTLLEKNSGTIMNLNIEIANNGGLSYVGTTNAISIAPFAITNNGLIYNVAVTGNIVANPSYTEYGSTSAAGIVITNTKLGRIVKATVDANISALDNYAQAPTTAGGIAKNNMGQISNAVFNGSIEANTVGGIVATNYGGITESSVSESAVINVTDKALTNTTIRKGGIGGGISARMLYHAEGLDIPYITSSYSIGTIRVYKGGDGNSRYLVGGLVGSVSDTSDVEIKNNYVVVNIVKDEIIGTDAISVFYMIENNSLAIDINLSNNYYYVYNCELSATNSRNDDGCKKVDSKQSLDSAVGSILDSSNKNVFDTYASSNDKYPTIVCTINFVEFEKSIIDNLLNAEKNRV